MARPRNLRNTALARWSNPRSQAARTLYWPSSWSATPALALYGGELLRSMQDPGRLQVCSVQRRTETQAEALGKPTRGCCHTSGLLVTSSGAAVTTLLVCAHEAGSPEPPSRGRSRDEARASTPVRRCGPSCVEYCAHGQCFTARPEVDDS